MREAGATQAMLARISGVHQPSISQFLSGRIDMSDEQLDRLLSCLGYRLEITRRAVEAQMTRSERRSWRLHQALASRLTPDALAAWRPTIERNLERQRRGVTGQPHVRHLERWTCLIDDEDVRALRRVLTGLDRTSIEMREVSPMAGLLSRQDRERALAGTR